jgi:hypothetical protein
LSTGFFGPRSNRSAFYHRKPLENRHVRDSSTDIALQKTKLPARCLRRDFDCDSGSPAYTYESCGRRFGGRANAPLFAAEVERRVPTRHASITGAKRHAFSDDRRPLQRLAQSRVT